MIRNKKEIEDRGIEIDLTGPQGNAFYVIGVAKQLCKKLGFDEEEILTEMKSGDYDNLVEVFENHFGEYVTLYK